MTPRNGTSRRRCFRINRRRCAGVARLPVVGRRLAAKAHERVVDLQARCECARRSRRLADEDREESRSERIERAAVTDALQSEDAAHHRDDVM
jgi:C4-dicarboxylate-specific signal transduction histidine kinase